MFEDEVGVPGRREGISDGQIDRDEDGLRQVCKCSGDVKKESIRIKALVQSVMRHSIEVLNGSANQVGTQLVNRFRAVL